MTLEGSTPKQPGGPSSRPVVLADGRHPVCLTAIDANSGTITFDLVQWYHGEDAAREAAKDHQESPPPNDYYIPNVNPKLRTLPTAAQATITVNNLLSTQQPTPVSLAKLATPHPRPQPNVLDHRPPRSGAEDQRAMGALTLTPSTQSARPRSGALLLRRPTRPTQQGALERP